MTLEQVKAFLTKGELDRLNKQIEAGQLKAELDEHGGAFITVRGTQVPLFEVLQLLGSI